MSIHIEMYIAGAEIARELAHEPEDLMDCLGTLAEAFENTGGNKLFEVAAAHSMSPFHRQVAPFLRALADVLEAEEAPPPGIPAET